MFSAAAIPEMLHACEVGQGAEKRISRFVIPFSVALSANGSAIFMTAAAVFLSNMAGVSLNAGDYVLIW